MIHDPGFRNSRKLLIKALLFFIPTQLGYHFWPPWAFVLGRRIDYLSPTIYFTDILIILILLTGIPFFRRIFRNFKVTGSLIFGLAFLVLNTVLSISPEVTLYTAGKFLQMALLFLVLSREKNLPLSYFVSGVILNVFLGLAQVAHSGSVGGIFWFLGERTFTTGTAGIALQEVPLLSGISGAEILRAYGTTPHPNLLASLITISSILLLMRQTTRYGKLFFAVFVSGLIATGSRSAIFAMGFSLVVFYLKKHQDAFRPKQLLILIGLLGLGALFLAGDPGRLRQSAFERLGQAQIALRLVIASPVFGTGLGTYPAAVPLATRERGNNILQPVHNVPLLFFVESGICGLIIAGLILRKIRKIATGYAPLAAAGLVFLTSDHYLYTLQSGRLLLVLLLVLILNGKSRTGIDTA